MKSITKEWLERALDDLQTMAALLNNEALTNIVAFHAQQAVEKALKAVIEEKALGFVRTHDLTRLHEIIAPSHRLITNLSMLDRLNAVYTESRYPGEIGLLPDGKPTSADAQVFYQFAQEIYTLVSELLQQPQKAEGDRNTHGADEKLG